MKKITLKCFSSRRYPDPLNDLITSEDENPYNIEHHILTVGALDVPSDMPKDPNPREQNIDHGIYREVRNSLDNETDLSFHLKNKGITVLAKKVEYTRDKKIAGLHLLDGDGIVDGAHTYEIIRKSIEEQDCPDRQYVKFEILTGVPPGMRAAITGGLNTAMQVQEASLMELEERFEWIKDELANAPYADQIAYKQNQKNDDGKNCDYDVRDMVGFLTLFNVNKFDMGSHPKEAYVSKAKCLRLYKKDRKSFQMLRPLLKEILYLHDYVSLEGRRCYNEATGGKAGAMGVFNSRKKIGRVQRVHKFTFLGKEMQDGWKKEHKLYDGALYPVLGALRFLVEQKYGDDVYSWKLGSFEEVKSFFSQVAPELIKITHTESIKYGRKPNPLGKDNNHWSNLYKTVALQYVMNDNSS